jgi:PAS domain S-box-containing protein
LGKEDTTGSEELRRLAETDLASKPGENDDLSKFSPEDMKHLVHELRVHQVELKMQNEELRRVQGELEQARDRYSHLYDFAPAGYFTVNENGMITDANLTAATLLQLERSYLMGSPFSHFILKEDQDIFYRHRQQIMDTQKPQSCRLRMVKKDASMFYASLECIVIETGDGHPKEIRAVVIDITEQKDLENQLRQAQKMEAIGTLAGGIAHDFNNILAAMIGFTELALDDVEKGTPLADNLKEVLFGGQRAKLLVQQILTFSRKVPQKSGPLWIGALVRDAVSLLRSTIPADIEIGIEKREDPCVMGDEVQVHQIVLNLCTNAAHAMEEKGGKLTIGVDAVILGGENASNLPNLPAGKYAKLTVTDTGSGILPENMERIFEPYFSTKEPGRGTGMGLAVVSGIVEAHKGHIGVVSNPKGGASFTVFLPMAAEFMHAVDRPSREALPKGTEHILFIDDELPIVKLNQMLLEKLGYRVTTRTSSVDALETFRAAPGIFDLVVTDMTMPNMNGDKLAAELIKIRPDIPVMICTGYSQKMTKELASKIGVKALVYKPLDKADLAGTVRMVLDASRGPDGKGDG